MRNHLIRQLGRNGVMLWALIICNEVLGLLIVNDGVKIYSAVYCQRLSDFFFFSLRRNVCHFVISVCSCKNQHLHILQDNLKIIQLNLNLKMEKNYGSQHLQIWTSLEIFGSSSRKQTRLIEINSRR